MAKPAAKKSPAVKGAALKAKSSGGKRFKSGKQSKKKGNTQTKNAEVAFEKKNTHRKSASKEKNAEEIASTSKNGAEIATKKKRMSPGIGSKKKRGRVTTRRLPGGKKPKFSAEEQGNAADEAAKSSKIEKKSKPLDRKAKKELIESRKRKRKPNFDLEKEVTLLWEKMRQRDLEPGERASFVSKALQKMKGNLLQMAKSHTSSRVLQSCVKHCREEERNEVFNELRPHLLDLAINTYACHLAQKMFDHAKKDQFQQLLSALHGNVVRLLRHPSGSAVVEHAYQMANGSQKQELVSEFFSDEYRLFRNLMVNGKERIADILSGEPASKHKSVLDHMTLAIQPILEKGIVDHSIIHRVLVEYLTISPLKMVRGIVEQLSGPLLVRMVHTPDGARLGVLCVRNGSPKERKKIIKGMKAQVLKIAHDDHGYAVLLSILDVVDDTELVNKVIISELAKDIKDLSLNKYGHRLILHLLAPNVPRYFPAEILKTLKCPIEYFSGVKQMEDSKENDDLEEAGVSKKDSSLRRAELLVKNGFGQKLCEVCAEHAGELLRSPVGKDVIYEVAREGAEGIVFKATEKEIFSVHKAIAELAKLPRDRETQGEEHVLEHYHASRTIRRLILDKKASDGGNHKSFGETLYEVALKGNCKAWAKGHSVKVIAAFRDSEDPAVKRIAKPEIDSLIAKGLLEKQKPTSN